MTDYYDQGRYPFWAESRGKQLDYRASLQSTARRRTRQPGLFWWSDGWEPCASGHRRQNRSSRWSSGKSFRWRGAPDGTPLIGRRITLSATATSSAAVPVTTEVFDGSLEPVLVNVLNRGMMRDPAPAPLALLWPIGLFV